MENLLERPVKGGHGVKSVFIGEIGDAFFSEFGTGQLLRDISHPHAVDIIVQTFPQIGIEELGKVKFIVVEFIRDRLQADILGIVLVDVL